MSRSNTVVIAILIVLLLAAIVFISISQYNSFKQNKQITTNAIAQQAGNQGYQQGYIDAVGQLFNEAIKCDLQNGVPVTYQNQTIHMIATECIQLAQQQQAQNTPQTQQQTPQQ